MSGDCRYFEKRAHRPMLTMSPPSHEANVLHCPSNSSRQEESILRQKKAYTPTSDFLLLSPNFVNLAVRCRRPREAVCPSWSASPTSKATCTCIPQRVTAETRWQKWSMQPKP